MWEQKLHIHVYRQNQKANMIKHNNDSDFQENTDIAVNKYKLQTMENKSFIVASAAKDDNTYEREYGALRRNISVVSMLEFHTLDSAAVELEIDLNFYPFNADQLFSSNFEAFGFMMNQGFADQPASKELESILDDFEEYQYYLVWAWHENNVAHYFFSGTAPESEWNEKEVVAHGLVAAISAQKAYFHALELLSSQLKLRTKPTMH